MFFAEQMPESEKTCCIFHVCINYADGYIPFTDENQSRDFYPVLASTAKRYNCFVFTSALMMTHGHFLLGSLEGFVAVAKCVKAINMSFCWIFRKKGLSAPFFKGPPKFAPIHTQFELFWEAIYIHRNGERDGHSKCSSLEREVLWGPSVHADMDAWRYFTTLGRDETRSLLSSQTMSELAKKCRDYNAVFLKVAHRFRVQVKEPKDPNGEGK